MHFVVDALHVKFCFLVYILFLTLKISCLTIKIAFLPGADGSKMDTGGDGTKSSKDSSSKQELKSNGDLGEERDSRDLIVDDDDDDDKLTEDGGDEGGGRVRVVREQERRYANNARERYSMMLNMCTG